MDVRQRWSVTDLERGGGGASSSRLSLSLSQLCRRGSGLELTVITRCFVKNFK